MRGALLLAWLGAAASETIVTGNPHEPQRCGSDEVACGCSAMAVSPAHLRALPPSAVQPDTFRARRTARYLGAPVTIWDFQQPARLSDRELPFSLLLVDTVNAEGTFELPAPSPEQAADSWFVGYSWSVIGCQCGDGGGAKHLGWKFAAPTGDAFFALIVLATPESEAAAQPVLETQALAEGEILAVGQDAPKWMLALLATVTAASGKR